MAEWLTALGLMCLIEGALYALFPDQMRRLLLQVLAAPVPLIRTAGLVFAVFGFLIVATLKGF